MSAAEFGIKEVSNFERSEGKRLNTVIQNSK